MRPSGLHVLVWACQIESGGSIFGRPSQSLFQQQVHENGSAIPTVVRPRGVRTGTAVALAGSRIVELKRRASMIFRAFATAGVISLCVLTGPASAQQQEGLVNLNVSNNNTSVQVPVSVAAQLCGLEVNAVAQMNRNQAVCDISQQQAAEANLPGFGQGQGQGTQQGGLVNLNIENNNTAVQVPVSVAAQLCGLEVNVVAQRNRNEAICEITQQQATQANLPGFGQGQAQGQGQ